MRPWLDFLRLVDGPLANGATTSLCRNLGSGSCAPNCPAYLATKKRQRCRDPSVTDVQRSGTEERDACIAPFMPIDVVLGSETLAA